MTTDQARITGIAIIIGLIVLGLILLLVIRAIVGKIIVAVLAVGLAVLVWSQRAEIKDATTDCGVSFFGIHLTPSNPDVRRFCDEQLSR